MFATSNTVPWGSTTATEMYWSDEMIDAACAHFGISYTEFDDMSATEQNNLMEDWSHHEEQLDQDDDF